MTKHSKSASNYSRRDTLRMMALGGAAGIFAPNLLTKPAFGQKAPRVPKGRIVVGLSQEPTVFNPLMAHIEVDDGVHFSVFDALFRIDPKGVIQPNLAVGGADAEERRYFGGRSEMADPLARRCPLA